MKNKEAFFSIVIPTRDRPDLIESLIWSILEQSFSGFELIICDNSNNELTQEVINKFYDSRINNIRTGNLQMSENYNVGINRANGKYLMCISDKGFLKQGALHYLYELIKHEKHQCITWALDNFVYPGHFSPSNTLNKESRLIDSNYILRFMLGADYRNYEYAPMHCTSCISMELVNSIREKHINLCQAQNPDYTMAAQILLATSHIYNLKMNLVILRNVSTKDGYGTGHSLVKKTQESRIFLKDHAKWIEYTNKFTDVPIKDCPFIIDLMLKDTYKVLEDNNIDPNIFMPRDERLICYYVFAYDEILWRKRLGVNMTDETKLLRNTLLNEKISIQNEFKKRIRSMRVIAITSYFKYLIKRNIFTRFLLQIYRKIWYFNSGKKYDSIEDCYFNNVIKNYKINS
jgi:glycosyltransferase involved in cell wall biosynthesis